MYISVKKCSNHKLIITKKEKEVKWSYGLWQTAVTLISNISLI